MRRIKRTGVAGGDASRLGRRRFMAGVGAGGLATAAVVFGRPGAAQAGALLYPYNCCSLCFAPSITVAACKGYSGHYLWYCDNGPSRLHCQCCETKSGGCPSGVKSAASCQYG
ncbi:hypothetical protein [Actinomadura sp. HBU206391]|uniref:hypothetical protein n=1 Tax=Actinomadura sp. HBU206391 TaxID=2731692 RepID=UPI001650A253|nr:hypothetical protein [Actinomadura sp. HBU206391]MBC6460705.1 hypothetical protein [Actinomadura sp. HBU206391]